jgi:hypothetical protein
MPPAPYYVHSRPSGQEYEKFRREVRYQETNSQVSKIQGQITKKNHDFSRLN